MCGCPDSTETALKGRAESGQRDHNPDFRRLSEQEEQAAYHCSGGQIGGTFLA